MTASPNITQLEQDLSELIRKDKNNWVKVYLLLKEVEENELWRESYHSFTAWVKSFCLTNKIHESVLWNRRRAGKVYEEYVANNTNSNEKPPTALEKIDVPMESIVLIDKIVKNNKSHENSQLIETKNNLIQKALNGELKCRDLKQAYQTAKRLKEKNKHDNQNKETKDSKDSKDSKYNAEDTEDIEDNQKITAVNIVTILNNSLWLQQLETTNRQIKFYKPFTESTEKEKYKTYTEFPVYTGSSRLSRRMDLLVVENLTTEYLWNLNLHGIEIKVDKNDLINDHKYTEYAEFVDFMWLTIPAKLLDFALETKFKECGVITIREKSNKAEIIEKAMPLKPFKKK